MFSLHMHDSLIVFIIYVLFINVFITMFLKVSTFSCLSGGYFYFYSLMFNKCFMTYVKLSLILMFANNIWFKDVVKKMTLYTTVFFYIPQTFIISTYGVCAIKFYGGLFEGIHHTFVIFLHLVFDSGDLPSSLHGFCSLLKG